MEKRISGHTRLLALIGSPVGHSGSPAMYNYSFEKLGLDYAYMAFDVKEDGVKAALDAMRLFNMRGMNVTMPDKVEAARYMDELSPAAQIIGAVNTISNFLNNITFNQLCYFVVNFTVIGKTKGCCNPFLYIDW